jgi:hypothetical protein
MEHFGRYILFSIFEAFTKKSLGIIMQENRVGGGGAHREHNKRAEHHA